MLYVVFNEVNLFQLIYFIINFNFNRPRRHAFYDVDLLLQDDDTIANSILHKNKSLIILNNN